MLVCVCVRGGSTPVSTSRELAERGGVALLLSMVSVFEGRGGDSGKPGGQHGNATGVKTRRRTLATHSLQRSQTVAPRSSHDQPLQTTASLQRQPSAHSEFTSAGRLPLLRRSWTNAELCGSEHLPVLQVFQEDSIISGYRHPCSSARDCILSLFQLTNETLNIWTHFLPTWYC